MWKIYHNYDISNKTQPEQLKQQQHLQEIHTVQNSSQIVISVWHAFVACSFVAGFASCGLLSDKSSNSGLTSSASTSTGTTAELLASSGGVNKFVFVLFISADFKRSRPTSFSDIVMLQYITDTHTLNHV